jgi:hypothetical protein
LLARGDALQARSKAALACARVAVASVVCSAARRTSGLLRFRVRVSARDRGGSRRVAAFAGSCFNGDLACGLTKTAPARVSLY